MRLLMILLSVLLLAGVNPLLLYCDAGLYSPEYGVREIPLPGPAALPQAEISGLTWYNDHLILLPQYPDFQTGDGDGVLFAISRQSLLEVVSNYKESSVEIREIIIQMGYFRENIPGFEGFEAIGFYGDVVFLTMEAEPDIATGYLVRGRISPDLKEIILDTTRVTPIPPQAAIPNASDETLLVTPEYIITIYEGNGNLINPSARAHLFSHDLKPLETVPFPPLEYRVTDATRLEADGNFWVINYFWPGDRETYQPDVDEIFRNYLPGETHLRQKHVERLVQLNFTGKDIVLADQDPVQLLLTEDARNWEGLVKFADLGFLIVTDKFPRTILGFIPWPE